MNPRTSVKVTMSTPLASAGSIPRCLSKNGIDTPAIEEASIFNNIEAPTMKPISQLVLNKSTAKQETIIDQKTPLTRATRNSRDNKLMALDD